MALACVLPLRARVHVRAGERNRGEDRGVPGAEVLRGEIAAADELDVGVDVLGVNLGPVTAFAVGEQLPRATAALERRHHLEHVWVGDRLHAPDAGLGDVVEDHLLVGDRDVAFEHRGEAVGLVALGVVLGADPEEAKIEQPYRAGEHALAGELRGGCGLRGGGGSQ